MPRYYKDHRRGYDLDRELSFCDVDGIGRVQLTEYGSFILICRVCFAERFRDPLMLEAETPCGDHGPYVPLTFELLDQLRPTMEARGIKFTSVAYRRRKRLEREAHGSPVGWAFGERAEADYPRGYAKD